MKQTINKTQFVTAFADMNRAENFSVEARELLFDWFEEMEESTGEETEFDPIAICCEFAESDLEELSREYGPFEDIEEAEEYLNENTTVVGGTSDDTVVYVQF